MGLKRLPNNASLDELLNTIEESEEKDVIGVSDDVFSFLSHFNILPGENLVLTSVIFDLYKSWSENPINKIAFLKRMNKHFFLNAIKGKKYFNINTDSISVEKKTLETLQKNKLDKRKYPVWHEHFKDFLLDHKITKGKFWVQSFVLRYFYDRWCYKKNKKLTLSEINFFNFCKLYFKHKRNVQSRMLWFGVSDEFIKEHLPPEKLLNLQQGREKKYGKRKKSKDKIPRP